MVKAKYPHLMESEAGRWDRYIEAHGMPEGEVRYDVHLGKGAEIDPSWPAWMVPVVKALSRHRADVVIERPDEVVIVELKSVAGMGAVGQLLGYEALWLQDYGLSRPVRLVCICEQIEADMESVFQFYEIEVVRL